MFQNSDVIFDCWINVIQVRDKEKMGKKAKLIEFNIYIWITVTRMSHSHLPLSSSSKDEKKFTYNKTCKNYKIIQFFYGLLQRGEI